MSDPISDAIMGMFAALFVVIFLGTFCGVSAAFLIAWFTKWVINRKQKALKEPKNNIELSEVWYNKGVDFSDSKEYEKALMAYDQALTFNDKDQDIWNNKSYVLTKLGKCDEAINAGNIAVKLAPNDPVLWKTLRDAYIGCNNQEKADECQKNVLKLEGQK
jgi:tetratricopeptide (TPR) repeat protein